MGGLLIVNAESRESGAQHQSSLPLPAKITRFDWLVGIIPEFLTPLIGRMKRLGARWGWGVGETSTGIGGGGADQGKYPKGRC